MSDSIKTFSSLEESYEPGFRAFLAHTDQKTKAAQRLKQLVDTLPQKDFFVDAGAGTGILTAALSPFFKRTLALEPNPALLEILKKQCSTVEIVTTTIEQTTLSELADFVLCSHVICYLEESKWLSTIDKMLAWLKPGGLAVIILQNANTDCKNLSHYFYGTRLDLYKTFEKIKTSRSEICEASFETVKSFIQTKSIDTAMQISEFLLNTASQSKTVSKEDLKNYIKKYFYKEDGSFTFSCHQDFLILKKK